ncbi:very short patch repair endonuclease [Actinoplanes sp. NPDC089786]|uniref:very short patch repair endonuclease n=1 Tax=Actinoplanes sp. NPDC089786 TaxID=3155185 RepID=UPI00342E242B
MRGNRSRDTGPERQLRAVLHERGLRYRINARPLTGVRRTADVVFPRLQIAVFVDGCYWHGCPDHYRPSRANQQFWQTKIEGNKARDAETDRLLADAGWASIRVWEHEVPQPAADRVETAVRGTPEVETSAE